MKIKKESVELVSLINLKVVERPDQNKRYNAPHLDSMGVGTQKAYSHIAIQEMSAVRSSFGLKNFHIFRLGLRKHFRKYVCYLSNSTTKVIRISETSNTLMGHCAEKYRALLLKILQKQRKINQPVQPWFLCPTKQRDLISQRETRISIQKAAYTTLGKIPTMGRTWSTAHCRDFWLAVADVWLIVRN